jgi:hypothetical protein
VVLPVPELPGVPLPAATVVPVEGVDVLPAVEVEGEVDVLAESVVDGVEGVAGVEEVEAVEEVEGVVLPGEVLLPDEDVVDVEGLVEAVEPLLFLPHAVSAAASASTSASLFMVDFSRADDGLAFWKLRPAGPRRTPARRRTRIRPTWSWVRCGAARPSGEKAGQQQAEAARGVDRRVHAERERREGGHGQQRNKEVACHRFFLRTG